MKEAACESTLGRGSRAYFRSVKATRLAAAFCAVAALSTVVAARGAESERALRVSLVQLIASPEEFDGRLIQVAGLCYMGFEDRGLYLNKEDYVYGVQKNAIWLDLKGHEELSGQYVMLEGTFNAKKQVDTFSGSLGNITRWVVQKKRPGVK